MKTAKTIKPYTTTFKGHIITVPEGSTVSNRTACGDNDTYRFWTDYHKTAEELAGYKNSPLAHDLDLYGLDIPAEYCEAYKGGVGGILT